MKMSGNRKPARRKRSPFAFFTSGNDLVSSKGDENVKGVQSSTYPVMSRKVRPEPRSTASSSTPKRSNNTMKSSSKSRENPLPPKPKGETRDESNSARKINFAFIDGQNLNKAIQSQGWNLDYKEFRRYLDQKYNVKKAYIFIGLITTNQTLYSALQDFGYHLVFKPTIANKFGDVKGNVDAEMVLYAITQINQYNKAVIVSGDGDFYTLVQYLQSKGKLEKLLVPNEQAYSALYDTLDVDASFVTDLRKKLEYTKHSKK